MGASTLNMVLGVILLILGVSAEISVGYLDGIVRPEHVVAFYPLDWSGEDVARGNSLVQVGGVHPSRRGIDGGGSMMYSGPKGYGQAMVDVLGGNVTVGGWFSVATHGTPTGSLTRSLPVFGGWDGGRSYSRGIGLSRNLRYWEARSGETIVSLPRNDGDGWEFVMGYFGDDGVVELFVNDAYGVEEGDAGVDVERGGALYLGGGPAAVSGAQMMVDMAFVLRGTRLGQVHVGTMRSRVNAHEDETQRLAVPGSSGFATRLGPGRYFLGLTTSETVVGGGSMRVWVRPHWPVAYEHVEGCLGVFPGVGTIQLNNGVNNSRSGMRVIVNPGPSQSVGVLLPYGVWTRIGVLGDGTVLINETASDGQIFSDAVSNEFEPILQPAGSSSPRRVPPKPELVVGACNVQGEGTVGMDVEELVLNSVAGGSHRWSFDDGIGFTVADEVSDGAMNWPLFAASGAAQWFVSDAAIGDTLSVTLGREISFQLNGTLAGGDLNLDSTTSLLQLRIDTVPEYGTLSSNGSALQPGDILPLSSTFQYRSIVAATSDTFTYRIRLPLHKHWSSHTATIHITITSSPGTPTLAFGDVRGRIDLETDGFQVHDPDLE